MKKVKCPRCDREVSAKTDGTPRLHNQEGSSTKCVDGKPEPEIVSIIPKFRVR